jgi:signal transduction histidine kinase
MSRPGPNSPRPAVWVVVEAAEPRPPWLAALAGAGLHCETSAPAELPGLLDEAAPTLVVAAPGTGLARAAQHLASARAAGHANAAAPLVGLAAPQDAAREALGDTVDVWLDPASPDLAPTLARLAATAVAPLATVARLAGRLEAEAWSTEQLEYLVHDLKNPLGTILTNLHLLAPRLPDETAGRLLNDAHGAAQRLERMVLNLLDVGRLSAGQLPLELIAVPLEDLVEEALVAIRPAAMARGVALHEDLGAPGPELVRVDFDLMTRVLVNLLENAIRHSPAGSSVRLTAEPEAATVRLVISDQGAGVPEEWRTRIFERFVQRGGPGPGRVGRGLGLAFARLVADAHGVPLGVEAAEPNGSRFYLGLSRALPGRR